ncbi:MAG: restriction endonuclease subunit S [Prevotellaceae bacterium]|nr:restriction endonuclease subunit S [Prevotellaceae bacterium]
MERYESYKDSGVKWLGEIPGHWEVKRFRFLFSENKKKNIELKENKQLQFKYGEIIPKERQDIDAESSKIISNYTIVKEGDIMINGLNLNYDFISQRVAMVRESGIITSAYIALSYKSGVNPSFYNYFMKSMDYRKMFHGMGSGIRLTLAFDNLKNLFFPYPAYEEQTAIANYLDSVTSKIDEAISQQQKMIDLLNERKQIIIQNAVTKGLDPNAKMKDSGVEWIGEIPEDWEISLIGHLFNIKAGGDAKPKLYSMTKDEIHKYPVYTNCNDSNSVYAYTSIPYFGANTITVTGRGDIGNAFFRKTPYDAIIRLLSLKPRIGLDCRFFTFFIDKVIPFTSDSAAVAQLSAVQLKNIVCCVPSKREQSDIADSLDDLTSKIDSSISQCNKMIALLQERKQIIINDVVTGKIKVV